MKLRQIGANVTLLCFKDGTELLFSYDTPVAGFKPDMGFFKTKQKFSVTTSRHINQYINGRVSSDVEQGWIEGLLPK